MLKNQVYAPVLADQKQQVWTRASWSVQKPSNHSLRTKLGQHSTDWPSLLVSHGEHSRQREVELLVARINILVSYCGLEMDDNASNDVADPINRNHPGTDGTMLKCPFKDCENEFSREQDLLRHYAIHYCINKTCCNITFKQAKKYMNHNYQDQSNRISYKKQCAQIRDVMREELGL
ncbi:hypothetical protein B0T26DRAFT_437833 [Lasiosphaeria miniovina]|uniref:C2H2-type domain-containing protein n=1 Tax=Lasiosphaeria miniovina TaxID=1954250 RepID=A0AA39ZYG6_9PEZI|nr:uncharacterized protein B0T26DRAFT_437833 [Lasiosphaeria miniovina]KAK0705899.1 hypothetical protein B0T26DRAFT_437833 [Lasiosphaeria miniovina]